MGRRRPRHRRLPAHATPESRGAIPPAGATTGLPSSFALPAPAATPRPRGHRRRSATTRATAGATTSATTSAAAAATTNLPRAHAGRPTNTVAAHARPHRPNALLCPATRLATAICHAVLQGNSANEPHARHRRLPPALLEAEWRRTLLRRSPGPVRDA